MGFNDEIRNRTKTFAINIIRLFQKLPKTSEAYIIGKQMLRSATSIGANFRAAATSRSEADFYSKLSIVVEEADETVYWIELLITTNIAEIELIKPLYDEAIELSKILSSSRKTIRDRIKTNNL